MLRKLAEIRSSNLATKLRWLIILSSVALVLVFSVWLISVQIIVAKIQNKQVVGTEPTSGLLQSTGSFFSRLGERTGSALGNLKNSIGGKEIQLKPIAPIE